MLDEVSVNGCEEKHMKRHLRSLLRTFVNFQCHEDIIDFLSTADSKTFRQSRQSTASKKGR